LGCDRRTLSRYLHRYPELKEHQVEVEETFCDKGWWADSVRLLLKISIPRSRYG
jgi:hypothetical protein